MGNKEEPGCPISQLRVLWSHLIRLLTSMVIGKSYAAQGDVTVTIDLIQPTGSRSYGTFQLGGKPVVVELQAHDVERTGEQLDLVVDMQRILFFNPKTDNVI